MANINIRAKDKVKNTLLGLCKETDASQSEVIASSLNMYRDVVAIKRKLEREGSLDNDLALVIFAKLLLNSVDLDGEYTEDKLDVSEA